MTVDDWCAIHGVEPVPQGCYLVCPECWHAYATEEELLAAHREVEREFGLRPVACAADVVVCPLCSHDL